VFAEARGDAAPPPGSKDVNIRALAKKALHEIYKAEAEALVWEGLALNGMLDLKEFCALDPRVVERLIEVRTGQQMGEAAAGQGVTTSADGPTPRTISETEATFMRTTVESTWNWRVAALAARRGYQEHEIQAMLEGPLSAPDVTALITAARNTAPDHRSESSGIGAAPMTGTAARDQASPEREEPREDARRAGTDEAEAAGVAAAGESGAEGLPGRQETAAVAVVAPEGEILSDNVEHLSRGDREGEDRDGAAGGAGRVDGGEAEHEQPAR